MDKTINFKKILKKLNKINIKNSKSFFKKNKLFNYLIKKDHIKKKKRKFKFPSSKKKN